MTQSKKNPFHRILLLFAFFLSTGCFMAIGGCDGGGGGDGDGDKSTNTSLVNLELGETKTFNSIAVDAKGSLLTIDSPDASMDGIEINIPPGSYAGEIVFTISYAPITGHAGNENLDPVTPLISVDNGGKYSDEIMTMKIPVKIEEGYHYMAFYYDETTGALEGIPEVDHDSTSLTIATRHFSKILINRLIYNVFFGNDTVASGFQVKQDNWQFKNPVTYLSAGLCSGMSIASLYYYNEKKKKQAYPPLFGFYDNGTSGFDIDDDQAFKLCSTIQWWEDNDGVRPLQTDDDLWTYFTFIHAILMSGEPQYVSISPPGDGAIGHAMVVYKKSGNDLYVSDPNSPEKQDAVIEFEWSSDPLTTDPKQLTGSFKPFEAQWNKESEKVDFTEISYSGTSAFIDSDFDALWNHLDKGTVPWNKFEDQSLYKDYPGYELKIIEKDASGTEKEYDLTDNYKTTNKVIKVKVETYEFDPRITAFYAESPSIKNIEDGIVEITLNEGDNNIGFWIEADKFFDDVKKQYWAWTDFQYITIEREKQDPQTESSISVTNTLEINAVVLINDHYPVDSYLEPGETWKQTYDPGTYTILVKSAGAVTNSSQLEYTTQISLGTGEAYVYDFENSQDCNYAKILISNQTPYPVTFYKNGKRWYVNGVSSIEAGQERTGYLAPGETYALSAKAPTWEGMCFSDCVYACWNAQMIALDCQGATWTISGSGTTCP